MLSGKTILFYLLIICSVTVSCSKNAEPGREASADELWSVEFTTVGMYSSARVADLTGDGINDIIIGTGKREFERADTAVVALSGATGERLWSVGARDQIYGSAALLDINEDGVRDVLIGGRSAVLMAVDGKTGAVIWEFFPDSNDTYHRDHGYYNFNNVQIIPDQTGDGLEDILVSNGGDDVAPPSNPNRPAGHLMVIDAGNGDLLARAAMPDGKETYMSPVISKMHESEAELTVIFGTGGETIGGNLYRTTLNDVMKEDLSDAVRLAGSDADKGFIAPAVLADITQDGYYDIIANAVEGKIMAIDGKENTLLWEQAFENMEIHSSLGVGHFNGDGIPDFFTTLIEGATPLIRTHSMHVMINGQSGEVEYQDRLGYAHMVSPVIADLNHDGLDEALLSISFKPEHESGKAGASPGRWQNKLVVFDFNGNGTYDLTRFRQGINLTSTPWAGDLDGNGKLDIIYGVLTDQALHSHMNGFSLIRLTPDIEIRSGIKWGSYMGSGYDGIYKN
ncbi:MAG: PQQ-binding-like beta-propeller repeat protein [Balneolales bacterium]